MTLSTLLYFVITWMFLAGALSECAPLPESSVTGINELSEQEKAFRFLQEYGLLKQHAGDTVEGRLLGIAPYQGDIMLSDSSVYEAVKKALFDSWRSKRAATRITSFLWEDAIVPYVFDSGFPDSWREDVLKAMSMWEEESCVQFQPRDSESYYLNFMVNPYFCYSKVGKQSEGGQIVFLNEDCVRNHGKTAHELGHALGFWHEHTRADRDNYIEILYDNIAPSQLDNFIPLPENELDDLNVPYDFGSIMHYPLDAFSVGSGLPTMRIKDGIEFNGVVGQRVRPSDLDIRQLNLLYQCNAVTTPEPAITTPTTPPPPLTCTEEDSIKSGEEFGLKSEGTTRRLWLGCTDSGCKLDSCPGNRFKESKRESCKHNIISFKKVGEMNDTCIRVGDEVALRMHIGQETTQPKTITCNEAESRCHLSEHCNDNAGEFSSSKCLDQLLTVTVTGKQIGEIIEHKDQLLLSYSLQSNTEFQCLTEKSKRCTRRVCALQGLPGSSGDSEPGEAQEDSAISDPLCGTTYSLYRLTSPSQNK